MPYLDVGYGHQLHYEIAGDITTDVPLLFVHGGPGAGVSTADKALFAGLQRPVVYFDQRGCGLSDSSVADFSLDAWVGDLEAVVDAAGLERFPLLGISQGASVSIEYAARHPERCVIIDADGDQDTVAARVRAAVEARLP